MKTTGKWLLAGLVCLAPWPAAGEHPEFGEASGRLVEHYVQLHYRQALAFAKETLRLGEEELGPNHPTMAVLLDELGDRYRVLGRLTEAEPPYVRALAIREKALGSQHPDVAQSLNNLAALYRTQGRYAEAEPLYQRAIAIREEALGREHPDVATSLENYAALLRELERQSEDAEMEVRAGAIRAELVEPN